MHQIHEIGVVCGTVRKRRGTSLLTLDSKTDFISWPRVNSAVALSRRALTTRTGVMGTAERADAHGHFSIISSLLLSRLPRRPRSLLRPQRRHCHRRSLRRRCDMMIKEWTDGRGRVDGRGSRAGRRQRKNVPFTWTAERTDGVLPMNGIPHGKG